MSCQMFEENLKKFKWMKWRPSLTEYSKITACPNCIFSSEVVLYREAFSFTHFLFSALNSILDSHFKPHLILIISFHPLSFLRTFHLFHLLCIPSFHPLFSFFLLGSFFTLPYLKCFPRHQLAS